MNIDQELDEEDDEEEYHLFEFLGVDDFNINKNETKYVPTEFFKLKSFELKNQIDWLVNVKSY